MLFVCLSRILYSTIILYRTLTQLPLIKHKLYKFTILLSLSLYTAIILLEIYAFASKLRTPVRYKLLIVV